MKVSKLTMLALLTAMALSLFVIEMQIALPVALPGVKLGLANIVTVYAVYYFNKKEVFLLVITKVVLGSIFSGQLLGFIYSLAGSMFCLVAMWGIKNLITLDHLWLSSVVGALFHNFGQIIVAVIVMESLGMLVYLPFLIIAGTLAGLVTGFCAQVIVKRIRLQKILMIEMR